MAIAHTRVTSTAIGQRVVVNTDEKDQRIAQRDRG